MPHPKIKRALIAVYDKTGIAEFAKSLVDEFAIEIISTGGTAKHLQQAGIPVTLVEQITGFPELLDGRVKTLHPKIHAAILADRDNPEHMRQLAQHGIQPIDLVVVNLYPFEKTIADPNCKFEDAIEMIDIGGPCLLRAATKNYRHVHVIMARRQFENYLSMLRLDPPDPVPWMTRWTARDVFSVTSRYDTHIGEYLTRAMMADDEILTPNGVRPLTQQVREARLHPMLLPALCSLPIPMRYGENPHQHGQFAQHRGESGLSLGNSVDTANPAGISFNNLLDADAALNLCAELTRACSSNGRAKILFAPHPKNGRAKILFAHPRPEEQGKPPSDQTQHAAPQPARRFQPISDETTSRRKLPHWQIPGAAYFVTFSSAIGKLSEPERDIVLSAVRFWDGKKIHLFAAAVMPDHVHMLFEPATLPGTSHEHFNLSEIMQSIKAHSGREIARIRSMHGQVWVRESYDRWIRNEKEFMEKWEYIADNPIKEGLANRPEEYRWWYGIESLGPFAYFAEPDKGTRTTTASAVEEVQAPSPASEAGKEDLCSTQTPSVVLFIKHTNPCGVGISPTPQEAYLRAYLGDPNAAMGGILACSFPIDADFAAFVMETYDRLGKPLKDQGHPAAPGAFFLEVWLAPSFTEQAIEIIRGTATPTDALPNPPKKKWGQNVRLLAVGEMTATPDPTALLYRSITGGMLAQSPDLLALNESDWKTVTTRPPTDSELADLRLAWLIAKHTKSNAISICKDGMLLGNGAGQMSRIMSCRIATWLANENGHAEKLPGAVAASDAFFPFKDGPQILIDAGITALIQPGGSKRDEETIAACNDQNIAMIFTGTRHFRH